MNTRRTLAVMLWCACVSPSSAQPVRDAKVPREVIQCGAFAAELLSREGEVGVWAVTQGALRVHTSAPSSSADSPFTGGLSRSVSSGGFRYGASFEVDHDLMNPSSARRPFPRTTRVRPPSSY